MEACITKGYGDIKVLSDSQLCIRQINKKYRVKKEHLKPLYEDVQRLRKNFGSIEFQWLGREDEWIVRCDEMARATVDKHGGQV